MSVTADACRNVADLSMWSVPEIDDFLDLCDELDADPDADASEYKFNGSSFVLGQRFAHAGSSRALRALELRCADQGSVYLVDEFSDPEDRKWVLFGDSPDLVRSFLNLLGLTRGDGRYPEIQPEAVVVQRRTS